MKPPDGSGGGKANGWDARSLDELERTIKSADREAPSSSWDARRRRREAEGSAYEAEDDVGEQSRSARAGLAIVLIFGFLYGLGVGLFAASPCISSEGMACAMGSMGAMFLGLYAGVLIIPAISLAYVWLVPRYLGVNRAAGCALVTILAGAAAVVGFVLTIAMVAWLGFI
jgi:hypothetical protein